MKNIFLITALLSCFATKAQYTTQGIIEFERKINIHAQMEDMESDDDNSGFYAMLKAQIPKFNSSFFSYSFNMKNALYKMDRETESPVKMFGSAPAEKNTVYTDFQQQKVVANKQVFEEKYLIIDTMRKMEWKINDEIRKIANYTCRKAVGKICDSVYVVAFYTEDIIPSGGPEMFSGLPGMILEIAIPRLHTTWIATKVELVTPKQEELKAPEKGKKTTQEEMYKDLMTSISKWGSWGQRSIWWSML